MADDLALSVSPIFTIHGGLIFANVLLPISTSPGNISYSFNSVPGHDQTQEILKSSVAHGLRGKQRLHPEVALQREGSIEASGGGRRPSGLRGLPILARMDRQSLSGKVGSEARMVPGSQQVVNKLLSRE